MATVELLPITHLRPLEMVFRKHLETLSESMSTTVNRPLIVSEKYNIVLDGSHRYAVLLRKGYSYVPVIIVSYDSPDVRVGTRLKHRFEVDGHPGITKADCINAALSGNLLPPRSTRHFFPFRKQDSPTHVDELGPLNPQCIAHLLSPEGVEAEIQHNRQYLSEIDEEVEILLDYIEEVRESHRYIKWQLDAMTETALFPGNFTPLHEGHLQTIMKLSERYNVKVLVTGECGVNKGAVTVLESLGIQVSAFHAKLVDQPSAKDLPEFDVLCSGNPDVLEWAADKGIEFESVDRSGDISARDLR